MTHIGDVGGVEFGDIQFPEFAAIGKHTGHIGYVLGVEAADGHINERVAMHEHFFHGGNVRRVQVIEISDGFEIPEVGKPSLCRLGLGLLDTLVYHHFGNAVGLRFLIVGSVVINRPVFPAAYYGPTLVVIDGQCFSVL